MARELRAPALAGLAPVISDDSRLLVLGSFPGVASLQAVQYYAHPQNHFWKILSDIWQLPLRELSYPERLALMQQRGLGLWDVYDSCEREGSLDSSIRNPVVNDFRALLQRYPKLAAIAHNGGESYKHSRHTAALGLPVYKLPSTSWSFERKRAAWHEVLARHGLA